MKRLLFIPFLLAIILATDSSVYALPFTINLFGCERHENFYGESPSFGVGVHGTITNPEKFDRISITDPLGIIILDTSDPYRFDPDNGLFAVYSGGINSSALVGPYTVTVTGTDGSTDSITVETTESSFSTSTPVIIGPVDCAVTTDPTPILSWEPFASAEKGPDETLEYFVETGHETHDPGEEDLLPWCIHLSSDVLSVTYNFDNSALPGFEELPPGLCCFYLFAYEDRVEGGRTYRRTSLRSSNFTIVSPTITVRVDIEPDTLNVKSEGKWITCYVELPEGYDVNDINVDSILLEDEIGVEQSGIQDGVLMVKFNRQVVIDYIELVLEILGITPPDRVTLTVTGELTDGTLFEGSDTIRVLH